MKNSPLVFVLFIMLSTQLFGQKIDTKREFTSIKEALQNPEKVFRLDLSNQEVNLSNEEWSKFVNLESLKLKNDNLKEIPLGITNLKSLKSIDLSGNDFNTLPYEFSNLLNLEELLLNDEKNIDLPKSLSVLVQLPKLKSLHLENGNLSSLPAELLLFQNLESLNLRKNLFKEIPNLEGLDHLQYLDMKNNNIKSELQDIQNINFGVKINF
jgi:Leucine-rich repeat (LRR) protein